ncbi:glycosyltransferase [Massilimicrobiota sp. SW1139]|uniref:glycosyltransferase n=1 Tax=Massilimicrobiota sp. SW1139 TaxID=2530043 RepID=UPI00143A1F14|nr:glycosyltransferase [Massilimicrobiota sp. SW1139]NJE43790.1 glycosyltransferase family 1 protein [Massilimicrobiota sp. SW1139]
MKVLHFIYGLNIGGAESYIYNMMNAINQEEWKFDFVIQDDKLENKKIVDLCRNTKAKIHKIERFPRRIFIQYKQLQNILDDEAYEIIHIHMNSLLNIIPILVAKKKKMRIIIHSHNTQNNIGGIFGKIIHYINRFIVTRYSNTIFVACGVEAGKWMFGKKNFIILDNAIPMEEYAYKKENRKQIRNELSINKGTIIGHVGRFVEAKNHQFIIKCFNEYLKKHEDSYLVLLGDGPMKSTIEKVVQQLGITHNVIFEGNSQDVCNYYSAFDCLLFPSIFEGLPFVLIEAQISGLPIICSTNVTKDVDLVNNIKFLSLEQDIQEWVREIENVVNLESNREKYLNEMQKTKYNIDISVIKLKKIYKGDDYESLYYNMQ